MSEENTISIIQSLREHDLSTYPIDIIVEHVKKLRKFPAHATEFHVGNVVYRIRPNEDSKSFESIDDLSYKPEDYNTTFQRASHPGQTMFYGSIIPLSNQQSEIDAGRVIAMAEGSKLFRDKAIDDGQEIVTFGMWRLQDTVRLATILHPDIDKNITPFAKDRANAFMEWLSGFPEVENDGKIILEFYAEEFAKLVEAGDPDYHYLHSAILTDFMIRTGGFHGVCYPSGRVEGKGINVAIHPNFVNAHMRLEGALECVIAKKGANIVSDNYRIAWVNAGDTKLNFEELISWEQLQKNIESSFNT